MGDETSEGSLEWPEPASDKAIQVAAEAGVRNTRVTLTRVRLGLQLRQLHHIVNEEHCNSFTGPKDGTKSLHMGGATDQWAAV